MIAHGTATDTVGASASADLTVAQGGATGLRTIRRSWMGSRIIHSSVVDDSTWGPTLGGVDDFNQIITGPVTLGASFTMMRDCNIVGVNLYKSPTAVGTIPVCMWDSAGTLLATKTLNWVSDEGGWREVLFDAPVAVSEGDEYHWGYFYPNADTNYAGAIWVSYAQDSTNYPFWMRGYFSTGTGVKSLGMWRHAGPELIFSSAGVDRVPTDYYIDPIAEWTDDTPGYSGGVDYFNQWENGGWFAENFPITVFWPNHGDYLLYRDAGINVITTGDSATQANIDRFKAIEAATPGALKWIPSLHGDDMSGPIVAQEDPILSDIIVGYFVTDEAELNQNPWYDPPTTLSWKNHARQIDSTRPCWENLSKMTADNQGFIFAPAGVDMVTKELNIRRYASHSDFGSLDKYSLAASESYAQNTAPGKANRFGIWTYPLCIKRMIEVTDGRVPVWGIVESTSEFPGRPYPEQVQRAVWSMLIAGARGIEYFDHRFPDADVSQDFGAFLRDPPMLEAITEVNTQIHSLREALFASEANLIESYTSTGTLAFAQGGYALGARIPLHYTSRITDHGTYLFVQAIRSGTTTATITCTALSGLTLTVIGEDRTVDVGVDGKFTDTFVADYEYHLYVASETPDFSIPVNTTSPALTTDGTPETGDTISVSNGVWTGLPAVFTYSYQWQRDGASISGATGSTYTLQNADETHSIRCRVTATNTLGSSSANSNAVTAIAAPAPSNTVAPSIVTDGTPVTGETISCTTGTWTGAPTSYTYRWQRNLVDIPGATSSTYTLVSDDDGQLLTCWVTASNSAGPGVANSNTITPGTFTSEYANAVMADNPVGYWRLDNLSDSSGNGRSLTASGIVHDAASLLVSEPGASKAKSFVFAESGQLSAGDASDFNPTAAMAWEAWFKPQVDYSAIVAKGAHRLFVRNNNHFSINLAISAGNLGFDSVTAWVAGQTYHLVLTTDGTNTRLYINGIEDTVIPFAMVLTPQTGSPLLIGNDPHPDVFNATGTIDEIAVYDHNLTAARVQAHYVAGGGILPDNTYRDAILADDPIAYWRLKDLTAEVGGLNFTSTGSQPPVDAPSLVGAFGDGAKHFTNESTQTLSIPDAAILRLTNNFSIEAWIKPDEWTGAHGFIAKFGHYRINSIAGGRMSATLFTTLGGGDFWIMDGSTVFSAGSIVHVVVTYNGSTGKLYCNGQLEATVSAPGGPSGHTTQLSLGKDVSYGPGGWGTVDELAIYDYVLNAIQIENHYLIGS